MKKIRKTTKSETDGGSRCLLHSDMCVFQVIQSLVCQQVRVMKIGQPKPNVILISVSILQKKAGIVTDT